MMWQPACRARVLFSLRGPEEQYIPKHRVGLVPLKWSSHRLEAALLCELVGQTLQSDLNIAIGRCTVDNGFHGKGFIPANHMSLSARFRQVNRLSPIFGLHF